tara:strand:+ start:195 stop:383 length:189 start_codon:yes stop_codon:yes gene_type:complete
VLQEAEKAAEKLILQEDLVVQEQAVRRLVPAQVTKEIILLQKVIMVAPAPITKVVEAAVRVL